MYSTFLEWGGGGTLFYFYVIIFSPAFIPIVCFIPAPEITTTGGKINVNSM